MSLVLEKPMLLWVISALKKAGVDDICVVKGYHKEYIEEFLETLDFPVESVYQAERLGTGHAVMMAKDFLKKHDGNVVILNGDAPFMTAKPSKGFAQTAHRHRLRGNGDFRSARRRDGLRQNRPRRKRQPQGDRRAQGRR